MTAALSREKIHNWIVTMKNLYVNQTCQAGAARFFVGLGYFLGNLGQKATD
jgi:hypothetical protein